MQPQSSINFTAVIAGHCPRCGKGALFDGPLKSVAACSACGLDLSKQDAGDGPAFFAITLVGLIVTGLAAWVEIMFSPPYWVHAVLWLPLIVLLSLWVLRLVKAYLIHLEFLLKERNAIH